MEQSITQVGSENTGYIIRHAIDNTNEALPEKAKRYYVEDSIVIALTHSFVYCFYIKGEIYIIEKNSTMASSELIEFFKDVLCGLYDYARDSFYIKYGRVATLCQGDDNIYSRKYDELLTCVESLWNVRYY